MKIEGHQAYTARKEIAPQSTATKEEPLLGTAGGSPRQPGPIVRLRARKALAGQRGRDTQAQDSPEAQKAEACHGMASCDVPSDQRVRI
mmetsp:Transcript_29704/g.36402  ORF Transcript_29704/g.36402 Transcript_29704/m.36402 type:complete len:89 (+) Transcript_29704:44-310(+)